MMGDMRLPSSPTPSGSVINQFAARAVQEGPQEAPCGSLAARLEYQVLISN